MQCFDVKMLWAAFNIGVFGFLGAGEFTVPDGSSVDPKAHLSYADIAVDSHTQPTVMRVTIKASKTDPFRKGIHIFFGVTGNTLCPVTAILSYMASRGDSPGPRFHFENGRHLTRKHLHWLYVEH